MELFWKFNSRAAITQIKANYQDKRRLSCSVIHGDHGHWKRGGKTLQSYEVPTTQSKGISYRNSPDTNSTTSVLLWTVYYYNVFLLLWFRLLESGRQEWEGRGWEPRGWRRRFLHGSKNTVKPHKSLLVITDPRLSSWGSSNDKHIIWLASKRCVIQGNIRVKWTKY